MNHQLCKNDLGIPIIETFENDNVRIARFINGETEIEFKPNCDKKVIEMYKQLIKPIRKGD
jgi:hypothetical protein